MKKALVLLLYGCIITCLSCKKDKVLQEATYLAFRVVDDVTSEPLPNVNATVQLLNINTGTYRTFYETTRADGLIEISFYNELRLEYLHCFLDGYVPKLNAGVQYLPGDSIETEARMARYDGVIRLDVENTSAATDSLYFTLRSGAVIRESGNSHDQFTQGYPLIIQAGEKKSYHIQTVAEDAVSMYWAWYNPESIALLPFQHVVIPPRGDTLVYKVTN